jgi:peptidoglycan/xylan/chitin deacetylase (PgdA/CDA1 family)
MDSALKCPGFCRYLARRWCSFLLPIILGGLITACATPATWGAAQVPTEINTHFLSSTSPSISPTHHPPTFTPNPVYTFIPTASPTPTVFHLPTPTPVLVYQGPGTVEVPILLYHHIAPNPSMNPYYVEPSQFEAQMGLLWERGYRTISVAQLIQALVQGADLPACPVIITFDDGNADLYTRAFPILQRYGFSGTLYLVVNYLDQPGFLSSEQVQELVVAGWEIGSHSFSHPNLAQVDGEALRRETEGSRQWLMNRFGRPIDSFAYPYGISSHAAQRWVRKAGYQAAMGVGALTRHRLEHRFYLTRFPVDAKRTLDDFARFLPWRECAGALAADGMTPRQSTPSAKSSALQPVK